MRTCSKCGAQFGDEMNYCLEDGSLLPDPASRAEYGEKTAELRDEPTPTKAATPNESVETRYQPQRSNPPQFSPPGVQRDSSRTRYLLPLTLLGLGVVTLGVAGIGLFAYFYSRQSDVASANVNTMNRAANIQGPGSPANSSDLPVAFPGSNSTASNSVTPAANEPRSTPTLRSQMPTPAPTRGTVEQPEPSPPQPPAIPGNRVPKTIAGGVLNGKAINLPKPPYPPVARAVRASGPVAVQVLIDEDGRVISANAVSGHPLLRGAAEQAARGARFSPTLLSGQPVKVSGVITYNFVP